jgi:lipopolysaccharide biosynthesis regulator YciM
MPEISPLTWTVGIAALVIGILAGHFGWGKRWLKVQSKLHPDYLAGLDYLVNEQPDRALDMFLKVMDADSETIETHFSLGSLYRRRGEVERAIRIHQTLLDRAALAPEHREQALLALAQDYLRAGVLDRAEGLFQRVSEVPRLRASALASLRWVYERQQEWQHALSVYRSLAALKAAPPRAVAAHYLCELAASAMERGDLEGAKRLLREARREAAPFPRAAVLRARIAESEGNYALAMRLRRTAIDEAPKLMEEQLPHLVRLTAPEGRDAMLQGLAAQAESRGPGELKRFVFAAMAAGLRDAAPLRAAIETVFAQDATLQLVRRSVEGARDLPPGDARRMAHEIGALLAGAEKYRCAECGFAGRNFYWHCPACDAWDTFETYLIVKLG